MSTTVRPAVRSGAGTAVGAVVSPASRAVPPATRAVPVGRGADRRARIGAVLLPLVVAVVDGVAAGRLLALGRPSARLQLLVTRAASITGDAADPAWLRHVPAPLLPATIAVVGPTATVVGLAALLGAAAGALGLASVGGRTPTPLIRALVAPLVAGPVVVLAVLGAPDLAVAGALLVGVLHGVRRFVQDHELVGVLAAGLTGGLVVLAVPGSVPLLAGPVAAAALLGRAELRGQEAVGRAVTALLVTPAAFTVAFFAYLVWWSQLDLVWLSSVLVPDLRPIGPAGGVVLASCAVAGVLGAPVGRRVVTAAAVTLLAVPVVLLTAGDPWAGWATAAGGTLVLVRWCGAGVWRTAAVVGVGQLVAAWGLVLALAMTGTLR